MLQPHFFDLDPASLREHLAALGMPAFRGAQVMQWIYQKNVADPQAMTNLSQADRNRLGENMRFLSGRVIGHQRASDGVQKLLVQWDAVRSERPEPSGGDAPASANLPILGAETLDAARQTECVMIPATSEGGQGRERKTACISSQVGCPVGCHFCASGLGGLDANLTAGQIVEQVWQLQQQPGVGRISHVVFMGMGEPLANFEQVIKAIRTLTADWGLNISARRITLSTVGLPAQIRRLADQDLPITLAISLHAPNDTIRRQLIPWAAYVTVAQLLDAATYYFEQTGREVTLEYTLLRDVNDRPEHAAELAQIARKLRCNVNLIRYNEVRGMPFSRPATEDVLAFQNALRKHGISAHIRASRGRDVAAACGQLRHEHAEAEQ